MKDAQVIIVNDNIAGRGAVAAGARISTQEGNALQTYARSGDVEKDLKLIRRVTGSGHLSVLEHHVMTLCFNDVSVMVEQFAIEFRLASFTVKSRRYVNFTDAGYVVPEGMPEEAQRVYTKAMQAAFAAYQRLEAMGIPREDARFVLPYALRSNFIVTINLRELIHMIGAMINGRGRRYPELKRLGEQLYAQVEAIYPDLVKGLLENRREEAVLPLSPAPRHGGPVRAHAALVSAPADAEAVLSEAMRFSGRFVEGDVTSLLRDSRPRELELLHYTFRVESISLACLTHFTRHRMVSALIPEVIRTVDEGNYVLPPSVRENAEARVVYEEAFAALSEALEECLSMGMEACDAVYFAQSGLTTTILFDVNARELAHFLALRTCSRAQWEIQDVAVEMLEAAYPTLPKLFKRMGPSCAVLGRCPEGRMSCGKPVTGYRELMEKKYDRR